MPRSEMPRTGSRRDPKSSSKEKKDFRKWSTRDMHSWRSDHCMRHHIHPTVANKGALFQECGSMGNSGIRCLSLRAKRCLQIWSCYYSISMISKLEPDRCRSRRHSASDEEIIIYTKFSEFGHMLKSLSQKGSTEKYRIAVHPHRHQRTQRSRTGTRSKVRWGTGEWWWCAERLS